LCKNRQNVFIVFLRWFGPVTFPFFSHEGTKTRRLAQVGSAERLGMVRVGHDFFLAANMRTERSDSDSISRIRAASLQIFLNFNYFYPIREIRVIRG
jgi:hypothetical protein